MTNSILEGKTLTISIEPSLTDEIKSVRIYLGEYYCSPVSFVNVNTLICEMGTLIAGKYDLRVKTDLGDLVNDVSITQIQVEIIVSNVSPSTVNLIFAFNKVLTKKIKFLCKYIFFANFKKILFLNNLKGVFKWRNIGDNRRR